MISQDWWYTTLLNQKTEFCEPLKKKISCDYLVIGGGIAGLHAALRLSQTKKKIVLLESNICGGGATGKSAGFLTPESELSFRQLMRRYGPKDMKKVWKIPIDGINLILNTIKKHKIKCDLQQENTLYLGLGNSGKKAIREEAEDRKKLNLHYTLYNEKNLGKVIGSELYNSAIESPGIYGINALLYAQNLKEVLQRKKIKIFEGTEVISIKDNIAETHMGSVKAKKIIVCVNKPTPEICSISDKVYQAQTFMAVSEPLSKKDIKKIFPKRNYMCWDTRMIYRYFRLTGDKRMLLGGGTLLTTFLFYLHSPRIIKKIIKDFKKHFPFLKHIDFIQYWPGLIQTTKDLMPIVDHDKKNTNITYVMGCVGLPWAAFCGDYAAKCACKTKEKYKNILSADRKFLIPDWMQKIMGKSLAFSLNNYYAINIQKD